jgi:hypothetical protein
MKSALLPAVMTAILLAPSSHAFERSFWTKVRGMIEQCAVQPVTVDADGRKIYKSLVSRCDELGAYEGSAQFTLEGEWYSAELTESEHSDGGDFYDVRIQRDSDGAEALRPGIPAFGDILVGLAGGRVSVPEIRVR